MNKKIFYRIIVDVLIAICILQGWWFVALPIAIISVWRFPGYIEIIVAGIAYDSLFGYSAEYGIWGYAGTLIATFIFVSLFFIRKLLRK